MKTSSRSLFVLVLVLLIAGWIWWFTSYGPSSLPTLEFSWQPPSADSTEERSDLPSVAPSDAGRTDRVPTELVEQDALEFEAGSWNQQEQARLDSSVLIEVRVEPSFEDLAEMPALPISESSFADIAVHLQTWDEDTDDTFAHSARTDAAGIARFELPGACHVDWVRADMPADLDRLAAFSDPHEDVPAGAIVRFSLVAMPGIRVVGRVLDTARAPRVGIPVHAMINDVVKAGKEIEDEWYPPNYLTHTREDGTFEFVGLPNDGPEIGVAPGTWLQIAPGAARGAEEPEWETADPVLRSRYEFESDVLVVETITIVERERIEFRLLDARAVPVPFARVAAEPLVLLAPNLLGEEEWEQQYGRAQTDWEREQVERIVSWPRSADLETDADGRAHFFGSAGSWRLHVTTRMGGPEWTLKITESPGDPVIHELRLPLEMSVVSGRVLDRKTGWPIEGASIRITVGRSVDSVEANRDGSFKMAGLPITGAFELSVFHPEYFTEVLNTDLRLIPVEVGMSRAESLSLRFLNQAGKPIGHERVRLVRRNGDDEETPLGPEGRDWLSRQAVPIRELNTNGDGRVRFQHLYPGTYDLELELDTDTGQYGVWGEALSHKKIWGRWSLPTSTPDTELRVDLSEYTRTPFRGYLTFTGTVTSKATGKPIPGAEVHVICGSQSTSVFTSDVGNFAVNALAGPVTYEISAPGHKNLRGAVHKTHGGRSAGRFDLEPLE